MNGAATLAIGIDIGGTETKVGLVDGQHALLASDKLDTLPQEAPAKLVERAHAAAVALLKTHGQNLDAAATVGVAVAGVVNHVSGRLVRSPNLPQWQLVPFRAMFAEAFGRSANLENDANAAAWGEFVAGAGRGSASLVMLTLGTGLGGGLVLDGRLVRGAHGCAGEMGHTVLIPDSAHPDRKADDRGRPCGCGQRGCLEQYVSGSAIEQRYAEEFARSASGAAAAHRLEAGATLEHRLEAGTTLEAAARLTGEEIAARVESDPIAARIWDETCRYLALACINLARLLDPELIVIGGGVSKQGEKLLAPTRVHYAALDWTMHVARPQIVRAELGNEAGMVGAAALARNASGEW